MARLVHRSCMTKSWSMFRENTFQWFPRIQHAGKQHATRKKDIRSKCSRSEARAKGPAPHQLMSWQRCIDWLQIRKRNQAAAWAGLGRMLFVPTSPRAAIRRHLCCCTRGDMDHYTHVPCAPFVAHLTWSLVHTTTKQIKSCLFQAKQTTYHVHLQKL